MVLHSPKAERAPLETELTEQNLRHMMFRAPWATGENLRARGSVCKHDLAECGCTPYAQFQSAHPQNGVRICQGGKHNQQPFMDIPDDVREFFRKQGRIGGKRRMKRLSPEERTEIARKAAQSRWAYETTGKSGRAAKSKANPNTKPGDSK